MATTKKNILDALLTAFGQIKPANGYQTTLISVDRHRDLEADPYDTAGLWAVNVRDGVTQVVHQVSDDEHPLPVTLDIITSSAATADEIDECVADVIRCISLNDTWGGYADGTNIESHGIDKSQVGDILFAATVEITINYTTDKGAI